jgi:PKD repeat protein
MKGRGLTEGAALQIQPTENHGHQPNGRQLAINPSFGLLFLIILGMVFITPAYASDSVPVASFVSNVTSGTTPLSVQFIDSSTNTPVSWFWSFGDGGTSSVKNPTYSYTTAGTYTVILTATNTAGSNTVTKGGYITVSKVASAPVAAFIPNVTTGTVPFGVQFVDLSTNSPASWIWSFGDGTTSSLQNPVHTYSTAGTYTVTMTATNAGGSRTVTKADCIVASGVATIPVASFLSTVTSGTAPLTIQFVDSSINSPTSWIWSFGDGNTSTLENPSHTYTTAGTYTVTLIATNTAGSTTASTAGYITVGYAVPVAGFTSNVTNGTAPLYVQFTDASMNSPISWSWKFGDGGTSTSQYPVHEYTEAGTYTVSLTAKNTAGSNITKTTGYITVTSLVSPQPSFTMDVQSGQIPLTVHFTDTSSDTPTSWIWSFGDGASSTEENPVHTYTTTGSFIVTLTAANAGGNRSTTASDPITAQSAYSHIPVTTVPPVEETPFETITTPSDPAAVPAAETIAAAGVAPGSSSFAYIIMGVIVIGVIIIGAVLYFRRPPKGGHHRSNSQL